MFRLPDFRSNTPLNDLRRKMKADLIEWQPAETKSKRRISLLDLMALETTGLPISINEIDTLPNGTFTYQGENVLLYIMHPTQFGEKITWPKYHISNCSKWVEMKNKGRQDRYVASRRTDGVFVLDVPKPNGKTSKEEHALDICKLCLDKISWKGFSFNIPKSKQKAIFQSFSLDDFFESYRKSLIKERPRFTPATSPPATYTDDFDMKSREIRAAAGWTCSSCNLRLTRTYERKFLHTHHRNGIKGDNSPDNLCVLCLGCHAAQPDHRHMKASTDYKKFEALYGTRSPVKE